MELLRKRCAWASRIPATRSTSGSGGGPCHRRRGRKALRRARFLACLRAVALDLPGLYRAYVGKNVLNAFRQDHGYKAGTYDKLWQGREDNVHLVELEAILPVDAPDYREALYGALEARYAARHEAPAAS